MLPGPAYRIHTPRLVIRCWSPADAPLQKEAVDSSLDHLRDYMLWSHAHPQDLQQHIEMIRGFRGRFDLGQDFIYGVFDRDESQVLGGTGLHPRVGEGAREIGYWVRAGHTGRGLAGEMASALIQVAFTVERLQRLEIHCDTRNAPSAAVAARLGFAHEATLHRRLPNPNLGEGDKMIWTLFADDYPSSPAARLAVEAFDAAGRRVL